MCLVSSDSSHKKGLFGLGLNLLCGIVLHAGREKVSSLTSLTHVRVRLQMAVDGTDCEPVGFTSVLMEGLLRFDCGVGRGTPH